MTVIADVLAYDPNKVKPGWIAFFVVMALVVATFFLWRSMNTQLGKIRVPPGSAFRAERADRPERPGSAPQAEPDGEPLPPPTSPSDLPSEDGR